MNRTTRYTLLALAAVLGLWLAWPAIVRTARNPVIGDYVPTEDPGTMLVVAHEGRGEVLAFGRHYHFLQLRTELPSGYTRIQTHVRPERDGVLGPDDAPAIGSQDSTFSSPQPTSETSLSGGFEGGHHLFAELQVHDGPATKVILAPPIDVQRGKATPWQPLAAVLSLGVLVEWQQTGDQLHVRVGPLPGATMPKWDNGSFRVLEAGSQFTADGDHQVSRLFLARVPSLDDGPRNVMVSVISGEDGIRVNVAVK